MPVITTTTEYWSITGPDGVDHPLNTLAYNIESWGDDRQGAPVSRGANIVLPFQVGETYVPKIADARTMTLAGWCIGESDNGITVPGANKLQQFKNNWRNLRSWFVNNRNQYTLTKRWFDGTGTYRTATAQVEFAGGMVPTMMGPAGCKFTVDIHFADPFFYGPAVAIAFDTSATGTYHLTILGDEPCRKITMAAAAKPTTNTLTNPRIDVSTTVPACYWYLNEVVPASNAIAVDFKNQSVGVGSANAVPNVVHAGFADWLVLNPGAATIVFSSAANNWSGTLTYVPTYF